MGFDDADYGRAATALAMPKAHVMAMAAVEAAGETFWNVAGELLVPVRFEAHVFGSRTRYRFNGAYPDLSCVSWSPELAAKSRAEAWQQLRRAEQLDRTAAREATSWGAFQVMGFHWARLGYGSVDAFVASMSANGDDGQMDAFVAFVRGDAALWRAMRDGDWDTVEIRYNGGGYGGAYARKIEAAVAAFTAPAGTVVQPPRILQRGMRGADVGQLQRALGLYPDDDFGPLTDHAVRTVQRAHGLVVDGIVGTMTRRALGLGI